MTRICEQDWDEPYISSKHEGFLEWKFVHCIDFLVEVALRPSVVKIHFLVVTCRSFHRFVFAATKSIPTTWFGCPSKPSGL